MAVLWVVQKIYLRTSRQLRFLELQFRAGIFSSFLDSVSVALDYNAEHEFDANAFY